MTCQNFIFHRTHEEEQDVNFVCRINELGQLHELNNMTNTFVYVYMVDSTSSIHPIYVLHEVFICSILPLKKVRT
jgi:hypothetical protein